MTCKYLLYLRLRSLVWGNQYQKWYIDFHVGCCSQSWAYPRPSYVRGLRPTSPCPATLSPCDRPGVPVPMWNQLEHPGTIHCCKLWMNATYILPSIAVRAIISNDSSREVSKKNLGKSHRTALLTCSDFRLILFHFQFLVRS